MARILCIEAGTDIGSVALAQDGKLVALCESTREREHAGKLALYADEILRANSLKAGDLDAVAVGRGPGSYTGLRIGTALAKGLCYGAEIPLIAIGSLEALCHAALENTEDGTPDMAVKEDSVLLPMIDARRMEVYCQLFDVRAQALSGITAEIITHESFARERQRGNLILFGNGAEKCRTTFTEPGVHFATVASSARGLIAPAFEALREGRFEKIAYFEPFYLKDFLATASTKKFF